MPEPADALPTLTHLCRTARQQPRDPSHDHCSTTRSQNGPVMESQPTTTKDSVTTMRGCHVHGPAKRANSSDGHVLSRETKTLHPTFSLSVLVCICRHRTRRDVRSSRDTTFARGRGHGGTGHVIACNIGHRCWLIYLACAAPYRHAVGIRDPCCRHLFRQEMGLGTPQAHPQACRTADSRPRLYKSLGEVDPI